MIKKISLHSFRNLTDQSVDFEKNICLVVGRNGSGKTSFLESIYTLANGKSFRSHRTKTIVKVGSTSEAFVLRGEFEINGVPRTAALKKSSADSYIGKIDGDPINSIGELAALCPTQVIEPSTFNILVGGSSHRRRFFDWGVFHVEHSFLESWKRYVGSLKQRNALLRSDNPNPNLLAIWDVSLAKYGEVLDGFRLDYFNRFIASFNRIKLGLLSDDISSKLKVSYYPGWDRSKGALAEIYRESLDKDIARKQTLYGAHRSDIKVTYKGLPVVEGLSRGQQKLLVICFYLASIETLRLATGKSSVLLLDDIGAELDKENAAKVIGTLADSGATVVCTALDEDLLNCLSGTSKGHDIEMFHVEHGKISKKDIFNK
jgi:DNA replication and repair protein RecF